MTITLVARPSLPKSRNRPEGAELSDIVEAIGGGSFPTQMLLFLNRIIGAEHCVVFQLKNCELHEIGSASLNGTTVTLQAGVIPYEVKRQLNQVGLSATRLDISNLPEPEFGRADGRSLEGRQRIMICGKKANAAYCVQILRSGCRDGLSESEIDSLRQISDLLISMTVKHADLVVRKPNLTPALSSLPEIENCVLEATGLSRREGEVCARILYGLSSCGIALDLGIGKESVMTYRKRAYHRLGIGSQRELLMWYLARWSARHGPYASVTLASSATIHKNRRTRAVLSLPTGP